MIWTNGCRFQIQFFANPFGNDNLSFGGHLCCGNVRHDGLSFRLGGGCTLCVLRVRLWTSLHVDATQKRNLEDAREKLKSLDLVERNRGQAWS